jgi:hypothetical protein
MTQSLFGHIPSATARLAAHILERLDYFGGEMTKRELQRKLNSHKYPLWQRAWEMLISRNCIEVTPLGSRRQAIVKLREIPEGLQARTPHEKRWRKRRRKRRRTRWFEEHLPEFLRRDGYEDRASEDEEEF